MPNPYYLQVSQQQVEVGPRIHGKFYASHEAMQAAWARYLSYNAHSMASWNGGLYRAELLDGTKIRFIVLEDMGDVHRIAGVEFFSLDVDCSIVDLEVLFYLRTWLRVTH